MRKIRFILSFVFISLSMNALNITDTTILSAADSLPLSVMIFEPERVDGVVQLVHGMCEHKERYIPFARFLADNGYAVVIHDHRGHGASVADASHLGYFGPAGYSAMIDDARQVGEMMRLRHVGKRFILLGHSMGSMVVRSFVKRDDTRVDGLIVCGSPSYNSAVSFGASLSQSYARCRGELYRPKSIQKMSFGSFNKKFKHESSPNSWICSDTAVVRAYDADPLCNFQFTANGFYNLFSLMKYTYSEKDWRTDHTSMPILFISGADDPCIVSPKKFQQAQQTMKNVGYYNVSSILYPNMRHEILNEIDKQKVWSDVLRFCNDIVILL